MLPVRRPADPAGYSRLEGYAALSDHQGEIAKSDSTPRTTRRGFCAWCGSTLTCESARLPTETHFYVGRTSARPAASQQAEHGSIAKSVPIWGSRIGRGFSIGRVTIVVKGRAILLRSQVVCKSGFFSARKKEGVTAPHDKPSKRPAIAIILKARIFSGLSPVCLRTLKYLLRSLATRSA
jgi:hypothetical protein